MAADDDDEAPGVPEWVVTYGDMMSLLLTFFIMLVSLSEVAQDEKYHSIMESLQAYMGYPAGQPSPPGENFPMNSLVEKLTTLGSFRDDTDGSAGIKRQAVEGIEVRVYRSREGDPVPTGEPILFARASDRLPADQVHRVKAIATELAGKPNKVEIRSFAPRDAVDDPHAHYLLAYARAREILARLEELGIRKNRLRIFVGETPAVAPGGEPLPEDRVHVVTLDALTKEFVGPRER